MSHSRIQSLIAALIVRPRVASMEALGLPSNPPFERTPSELRAPLPCDTGAIASGICRVLAGWLRPDEVAAPRNAHAVRDALSAALLARARIGPRARPSTTHAAIHRALLVSHGRVHRAINPDAVLRACKWCKGSELSELEVIALARGVLNGTPNNVRFRWVSRRCVASIRGARGDYARGEGSTKKRALLALWVRLQALHAERGCVL